jgi:GTP-binding protein
MELRRAFLPLIKTYIAARDQLRVAFMLIDIRRVPDDYEKDIITLLSERSVPVAIIATKCDKLSRGERRARAGKIAEALEIDPGSIFFSSTRTGEGRKEILGLIHEYGGR